MSHPCHSSIRSDRSWRFTPAMLCLAGLVCGQLGCATHLDQLNSVRHDFFANQLSAARTNIGTMQEEHPREANVLALDRAIVELADGDSKKAEQILRKVRDEFDHLSQKNVAEDLSSLATDETYRAYAGEDYEQVLIRVMLTISSLMHGGEDANAYALQVTDKQQQLAQSFAEKHKKQTAPEPKEKNSQSEDKVSSGSALAKNNPEQKDDEAANAAAVDELTQALAYQQVALGPYVRAALAEESPLTLHEAVRARVQVAEFAPDLPTAQSDIQRAKHEVPIPAGEGVLYVFAFVGRGPVKVEENAAVTQVAMLIADRIISAVAPRDLPPTIAPVPIPKVSTTPATGRSIRVAVDGRPAGETATIVDVGQLAKKQQEAHEPELIARAVLRRVLKKGVVYAAKDMLDVNPAANLALNIVGVAWEATENADLRCWGLLPDRIQVLRVPLSAGEHDITLKSGSTGRPFQTRVFVPEGRNVYLLGQFPDHELIGELVTSSPATSRTASAPAAPEPTPPAPEGQVSVVR